MEHHYQHKTAFYKKGRLGYSEEAVQLIAEIVTPPAKIVDMGSGTGIFAASLLNKGYTVYGVEPDVDLQQKAKERFHHFKHHIAITAPAENTCLPDHSVDGITAASAFHWFDPGLFQHECKRIIKPNGYVFLLYNVRQTDDLFSQEQKHICQRYCPSFTSLRHGVDKAKDRCSAFFPNGFEEKSYSHDLVYTKDQFLFRCLSSSYSLDQKQVNYRAYRQELEQLIAEYSIDGLITIHNHTTIWYGTVK